MELKMNLEKVYDKLRSRIGNVSLIFSLLESFKMNVSPVECQKKKRIFTNSGNHRNTFSVETSEEK